MIHNNRNMFLVFSTLMLTLIICVVLSICIGSRFIGPSAIWNSLWSQEISREAIVIWNLRLPRTLLGLTVGGALGVAGALMQAMTRNPLADPGLLGINAGAALAIVTASTWLGVEGFPASMQYSLLGCIVAAVGVYVLSRRQGRGGASGHVQLVLSGAAISASLRACTGIITMSNSSAFDTYRFWVIGSLGQQVPGVLPWIIPLATLGILVAFTLGGSLNASALGDELVKSLGVRVWWTHTACFGCVVLLCGVATAAAGPIAFVGLAVPHLVRLIVGPDWRWILPYSALTGATLLLASDILGRLLVRPGELEVGIVSAFLGAPLLIWLVVRRRPT